MRQSKELAAKIIDQYYLKRLISIFGTLTPLTTSNLKTFTWRISRSITKTSSSTLIRSLMLRQTMVKLNWLVNRLKT